MFTIAKHIVQIPFNNKWGHPRSFISFYSYEEIVRGINRPRGLRLIELFEVSTAHQEKKVLESFI